MAGAMCQLALWWRSCMAWGLIWGKTGWSRCQIIKHIFKGHWEWEYVHVLAVCMCALVFEFVHVFLPGVWVRPGGCKRGVGLYHQVTFLSTKMTWNNWFYFADLGYQYLQMLCLKFCCWLRLQDGSSLYLPPTLGQDTSAYWDTSQLFEN